MNVSHLPDPESHPLWPGIEALLKPAAEYGGTNVRDDGELVWIAFDGPTVFAAATTSGSGDEAQLLLAGGTRHRDWIAELDRQVSAWARQNGATKLTMRGREGWARYAALFGWVRRGTDEDGLTIYEKDLR